MFTSAKVISRKFTQTGNFLFDVQVSVKAAKAGDPDTVTVYKAMLTPQQIESYKNVGLDFPKVGETVTVEQTPNPTTGEISKDWVSLCA